MDIDIILADYHLPGYDGFSALAHSCQHAPQVPFIFLSEVIGEDVAIESLKLERPITFTSRTFPAFTKRCNRPFRLSGKPRPSRRPKQK